MEATIHPPSSISIPQYIFAQISGSFYFTNPCCPILHPTPPTTNKLTWCDFLVATFLWHQPGKLGFSGGWLGLGAARSRAEKVGKLLKLELALEGGCEVGHSVVLDSLWPMTRIKLITLNMLTLGLKALHWWHSVPPPLPPSLNAHTNTNTSCWQPGKRLWMNQMSWNPT